MAVSLTPAQKNLQAQLEATKDSENPTLHRKFMDLPTLWQDLNDGTVSAENVHQLKLELIGIKPYTAERSTPESKPEMVKQYNEIEGLLKATEARLLEQGGPDSEISKYENRKDRGEFIKHKGNNFTRWMTRAKEKTVHQLVFVLGEKAGLY